MFSPSKKFNLTVNTNDAAAEITILDSQFQRVDLEGGEKKLYQSSEQMVIPLNAGLYTVKVVGGAEVQEKSIAIINKDEVVDFLPIRLSSPVPWEESTKTHEYHLYNAVDESNLVHVTIGSGSQFYFFTRIWTTQNSTNISGSAHDPAIGFTLRDLHDKILVDIGDPKVGKYRTDGDPWSACNIELDPGLYCLCFETDTGTILKQSIVTSPGWQTQLFLLEMGISKRKDYSLSEVGTAMSRSSIFMVEIGHGFKASSNGPLPDDPNLRLTELARQALVCGRLNLSTDHLHQMLSEKFSNPMLGIYGCHLFLMDNQDPNLNLLAPIIVKLRTILHDPHPDVEAIALKLGMGSNYVFSMPPMLIQSWNFILEASIKHPRIIKEHSLASNISGQLWSSDQWVIWGQKAGETGTNLDFLSDQIKKFLQPKDDSFLSGSLLASIVMDSTPVRSILEAFENDDKKMESLVKSFGVPKATLESIIKSFNS